MSVAYIDASAIIAVDFSEPRGPEVLERLSGFSKLVSSNLLESEVRAVYAREGRPFDADTLSRVEWVFPTRPLSAEIETALSAGYLRGADLHHVATALYMAGNPERMAFVTLDIGQGAVAAALGFRTEP